MERPPTRAPSSSSLPTTHSQGCRRPWRRRSRTSSGMFAATRPSRRCSASPLRGSSAATSCSASSAARAWDRAHRLRPAAGNLINLGHVCDAQGEQQEAQAYYERALRILEKALGADHPHRPRRAAAADRLDGHEISTAGWGRKRPVGGATRCWRHSRGKPLLRQIQRPTPFFRARG